MKSFKYNLRTFKITNKQNKAERIVYQKKNNSSFW